MPEPHALVAVESPIARDPRARRQIAWLRDAGFVVDSLALGEAPPEPVRDHFVLAPSRPLGLARALRVYLGTPRRQAFRETTLSRVPAELRIRVERGDYQLVVLNDWHLAPWVADDRSWPREASRRPLIHLDIHEYFDPALGSRSVWHAVTRPYRSWVRRTLGHPAITSRSTVNRGIAELYERELGVERIAVVRSAPAFMSQDPSPVDDRRIRLIHHGSAHWNRGLKEMLDAMALLDERFELTLMLLGDHAVESEIADLIKDNARIRLVPPVATHAIPTTIRDFDVEVMFFPPRTKNLELALPNKLFEAIQGRLAVVSGPSSEIAAVIGEWKNGLVTEGWTARDLATALSSLSVVRLEEMKAASHRAAKILHAEAEGATFIATALGRDGEGVS